jgi:hypothetical protein
MKCRRCRESLERYLDNELSGSERAALERHLESCAECRKQAESLKALSSLLQSRAPVEPTKGFLDGFNDRFWQEVKRRRRSSLLAPERRLLSFTRSRVLATAAAALLLVAVGVIGYRSLHTIIGQPAATAVERAAPEEAGSRGSGEGLAQRPSVGLPSAEPRARKTEPATEETKPFRENQERPAVQPASGAAIRSAPVGGVAAPIEATESGTGRGLAPEKSKVQKEAEPSFEPAAPAAPPEILKKQDFKLVEGAGKTRGGQAPGKGVGGKGGNAKTVSDTTVYDEDELGVRPALVSIPEASDADRQKYPDMELTVWVLVEKDGSVSRAESRSTTANAGLENVALGLARRARFVPGKKAGVAVRAGKTITVRIRDLKRKGE